MLLIAARQKLTDIETSTVSKANNFHDSLKYLEALTIDYNLEISIFQSNGTPPPRIRNKNCYANIC